MPTQDEAPGYAEKSTVIQSVMDVDPSFPDGPITTSSEGTLYVDHSKNQIGIKDGHGNTVSVPLSDALELLRKGVL